VELLDDLIHKRYPIGECDFGGAQYRCAISITAGDYDSEIAKIHNQALWLKLLWRCLGTTRSEDQEVSTFIITNQCFCVADIQKRFLNFNRYQCAARIGYLRKKGLLKGPMEGIKNELNLLGQAEKGT
jgi:hypothetical protein